MDKLIFIRVLFAAVLGALLGVLLVVLAGVAIPGARAAIGAALPRALFVCGGFGVILAVVVAAYDPGSGEKG